MDIKKDVYLKQVLAQMPRILGLLNRNPSSPGYGCFDRNYWQYKIVDFPTARAQEAVLALAILYRLKHPNNPFFNKQTVLGWIKAGIDFWCRRQKSSGSFEEWYPLENSYVATAFSLYAISETYKILTKELEKKHPILPMLEKSATFISRRTETRVLNQETGALAALFNVSKLSQKTIFKQKVEEKVKCIISHQDQEGWLTEYGGADVGYLSVAISYLSKYYTGSRDERIKDVLKKALTFLVYFLHPDYTVGGSYGSRQTEYLLPHGIELGTSWSNDARTMAYFLRFALLKERTIGPMLWDERYLLQTCYDYLQAYIDGRTMLTKQSCTYEKNFRKTFLNANLAIISNPNFYVVINTKKSSFKISWKNLPANPKSVDDSGIEIVDGKGARWTSNNNDQKTRVEVKEDIIAIEGNFHSVQDSTPSLTKSLGLRAFQSTFGKSQHIGNWVKERLRDATISKGLKSDIKFMRKIEIENNRIRVEDKVFGNGIKKMLVNVRASYLFVPSSKYFGYNDIKQSNIPNERGYSIIRTFKSTGEMKYECR